MVFYADVSIKHARVVTRDPLTLRVARGIDTILVVYTRGGACVGVIIHTANARLVAGGASFVRELQCR